MAGPDGLSEEDGAGTATGTLAGGESPIVTGAHYGLSVRIESVKEFFCFDIPPGGGREIVSRKRKDSKNREIGRGEKDSERPRFRPGLSREDRSISKILQNSRLGEILREDVRLDGWPVIKD